jgi:hypothetical protein
LWQKNQVWRDNLARRAAHKALNIPDEDMQIHSSNQSGIGAAGAVGIAAVCGVLPIAAALGTYLLLKTPAPITAPAVQEWDLQYKIDGGPWKTIQPEGSR